MASVNLPRLPTWLVQACDVMFSFRGCSPLQHLAEDRGAMVSVGLSGRSAFDKDHGHLFRILNLARTLLGTLLLVFLIQTSAMPEPVPQFTNITRSSGVNFLHLNGAEKKKPYLFEAKGGGAGFFDFDKDGWLDLLMVQGSTLERFRNGNNPHCALYRNRRDGTFADRTKEAGLTRPAWGMGVTFGDYDNDGFVDIYLNNLQTNVLYKNQGDGTFQDVTVQAGVGDPGWSSSSGFGDYDQDGDLDLYVCNYVDYDFNNLTPPGSKPVCSFRGRPVFCGPLGLRGAANRLYRNNGDGTFADVTEASGMDVNNRYFSLGVVWADLDNDGDLDLYVANDSTPNQLYVNQGDGKLKEMGFLSGLATNADGDFQGGMGVDVADYDNDGRLDVFVTNFANDYSTLYRNRGALMFEDVTQQARLIQPEWMLVSWGAGFFDLNHDGWKDIFHSNGHTYPFVLTAGWSDRYFQPSSFYLNQKNGTFKDVRELAGRDLQKELVGRGMAFGDFDNDGDIDFVIGNLNGSLQFFRHEGAGPNHWVMFRARGAETNRDGIGTRITVFTGQLRQVWEIKRTVGIYSASDPRAHFGLGEANRIDRVQVKWPSGTVQEFRDVAVDRHYLIDEAKGLESEF